MEKIVMLPIEWLHPHPDNPRKNLGDLEELTASIKANGIFQNLTVVHGHVQTLEEWREICKAEGVSRDNADGTYSAEWSLEDYTVIIGHRRLAAAQAAGLSEVPCAVVEMTAPEQMRTMMVENMQRSDLTPIEQADGMQMMLDLGYSKEEISEQTGFSRTTIDHRLKMRELNRKKLQAAELRGGTISDYIALEKIKSEKLRNEVLESIGTENFRNKLRQAMEDEKMAEEKERIIPIIREFAQKSKEKYSWSTPKGYEHEQSYNFRSENKVVIPTDDRKRVYTVGSYDVAVYVEERKKKTPDRSDKDRVIQEFERWEENCEKQLKEITKRHKILRLEFVKDFGNFREHIEEIAEFAALVNANNNGDFGRDINKDIIEELTGIEKRKDTYNVLTDDWKRFCRENPIRALLFETISKAEEGYGNQYWDDSYSRPLEHICNEKYVYVFKEKNSKGLNCIYGFLKKLGYQISDEENEMSSGAIVKRLLETMPAKNVKDWKKNQKEERR